MLAALALIVPLGLAAAISPVMLTEQTVLLAGPDGYRAATRYTAGVVVVLLLFVSAMTLFGRAISLPTEPRLSASLDLILGLVLLCLAVLVRRLGRRGGDASGRGKDAGAERPAHSGRSRAAAFPFGVFSMATNFTSLALLVPAVKEISTAGADVVGRIALILVLVGLAAAPAWLPVALSRIAPGPGRRVLIGLRALIARRGRTAIVVLLAASGLFFAARGIIRLLG